MTAPNNEIRVNGADYLPSIPSDARATGSQSEPVPSHASITPAARIKKKRESAEFLEPPAPRQRLDAIVLGIGYGLIAGTPVVMLAQLMIWLGP